MQLDLNEKVAENKLLILYLINQVNFELTNSQIAKLVIKINEINYFYLQQYISQLIDDKYLDCRIENDCRLYRITDAGKQVLDFFKTMIRASARSKIESCIREHLPSLRTETQVTADYTPINEDEYTVTCKITEEPTCLMELNLYAGTREQARMICQKWQNRSQEIYSKIIRLLTEDEV